MTDWANVVPLNSSKAVRERPAVLFTVLHSSWSAREWQPVGREPLQRLFFSICLFDWWFLQREQVEDSVLMNSLALQTLPAFFCSAEPAGVVQRQIWKPRDLGITRRTCKDCVKNHHHHSTMLMQTLVTSPLLPCESSSWPGSRPYLAAS